MIVIKLCGGLGNQMFQYASGKALALHHKAELKLDIGAYRHEPDKRIFELSRFQIEEKVISHEELQAFVKNPDTCTFEQPHYHYYENFFDLPSNCYLLGYWQSEKYFIHNRAQILSSFALRYNLDLINQTMIDRFRNENSTSIHVRRGDYVYGRHTDFFKALDISYYRAAIHTIKSLYENVKFYVFSDDLTWCKAAFQDYNNIIFVDHNMGNASYADMMVMSACRHHIIANSTFSWWAAWLNPIENKTVIAPGRWFGKVYRDIAKPVYRDRRYDTKDLIPKGWLIL